MEDKYLITSKKFFNKILIALNFLFCFLNSKADLSGGEISYQCLGNGYYQITMKMYRDCQGVPMCNCPSMTGCTIAGGVTVSSANTSVCSFTPITVTMNIDPSANVSGYDVIQLCRSSKTICTNCGTRTPGTMLPAIEVYTFKGTANLNLLPSNCCQVIASWSDCCRNAAITNIQNPSASSTYLYTSFNKCQSTCNSSPVLTTTPPVLVCAGQVFTYNPGAIDAEGDSLSYDLVTPLISANASVAFKTPYSANYQFPLLGNNPNLPPPLGLSVNHITGNICFVPTGNYVIAFTIEITEWKRDIYGQSFELGRTRRDLMFYSVTSCQSNVPPQIVTYNESGQLVNNLGILNSKPVSYSPKNNWAVCANKELCFFVEATDDITTNDTTDLNFIISGTIADTSKGRYSLNPVYNRQTYDNSDEHIGQQMYDKWKFCWTPNSSAYRPDRRPYYFTVSAKDRMCPIPGRSMMSFAITVNQTPDATISIDSFRCNNYRFKYALTPQTSNTIINHSYTRWYVETEPGSGKYVSKSPDLNNPYRMSTSFAKGGKYNMYLRLASIAPPTPDGCPNDSIPFTLNIPEFVKVIAPDAYNCFGKSVKITANGQNGTPSNNSFEYFKQVNGGLVSLEQKSTDSSIVINPTLNTTYKVVITESSQGCTDTASFNFNRYQSAQKRDSSIHIGLIGNPAQCVNANSFTFTNLSNIPNVLAYYWKSEDGSISNDIQSGITKIFNTAGPHTLSLLALKDTLSCLLDSNYMSVTIHPTPNVLTNKTGNIYKCQNDSVLVAPIDYSSANDYVWFYKNTNQISQSYPLNQSSIYMNAVGNYYLMVKDKTTQCSDTSTTINFVGTLKIPAVIVLSKSGILCNYEPITLTAPSNTSYRWLKNGTEVSTNRSITINQEALYTLITGSGACADTNYYGSQYSIVNVSNNGNQASYTYCPNSMGALVSVKPVDNVQSYDWILGSRLIKSGLDNTLQLNAGNNTLKLIATNILGCKDSLNISLNNLEMKTTQLSIIGDTNACRGTIANISNPVLMDTKYYFQKEGVHYDSVYNYINVSQTGNYRLILKTISTGCMDTSRVVHVIFNNPPVLSKFTSDTINFCEGALVDLNANGTGTSFIWKYNRQNIPNADKSNIRTKQAGYYTVINGNGSCFDSASVYLQSISKPSKPIITALADTLVASSNGNLFAWYFNNQLIPNATASRLVPQNSGNYKVIVSNISNCSDTSNDYIFIKSGVADISGEGVKLFPNPTASFAKLDLLTNANWQVQIIDLSGKTIRSYKAFRGKEMLIYKEDIKTGEYIIYMKNIDANTSFSTKLIFE